MNKNFKPNERELIKIATFFKKQSKKLIAEGKLGEENSHVAQSVDHFIEHMNNHANTRAFILEQRDYLKKLVKDNAQCPQCHSSNMLKLAGTEKNEKGWKHGYGMWPRTLRETLLLSTPNFPMTAATFITTVYTTAGGGMNFA